MHGPSVRRVECGLGRKIPIFPPKRPSTSVSLKTILGVNVSSWLAPPTAMKAERLSVAPIDPLYLFYCGLRWHKQHDPSSGWELIRGMRSWDPATRAVSAALLAKADECHLLTRDLRRARKAFAKKRVRGVVDGRHEYGEVKEMHAAYGLEAGDGCQTCKLRNDKWFCSLSPEVLKSFSAASHSSVYPAGALLFVEGQMPRGAFVLCSGKVKLSTTSREGKVLILKVAEAGEVLGLSAMLSGTPYEVTGETGSPCQVDFIERETLLKLMEKSGELGLRTAQTVSREFQSVYRDIHELVLARSSAGKLARLLLSWMPGGRDRNTDGNEVRIRSSLTHEEMAQMIGSSRETVTRLLSELKKKEFIRLDGTMLVIRNRTALEALAA